MDYAETLTDVFVKLQAAKRVKTKKDFANLLGMSYSNLVSAMKGDVRYATKNLASRATLLLDETSDNHPAKKEFVIPAETLELYNNLSRTIEKQAEIIEALLGERREKKRAE